jgi:tRNA pseudouridine synthase 10
LRSFPLCSDCADRQGSEEARFSPVEPAGCFICGGLTASIASVGPRLLRKLAHYDFKTFSVGMILPAGVQEREDEVRSELRIRGRETIKSDLAKRVSGAIRRHTRRRVDRLHPDLTVLLDLELDEIRLTTRAVFVHGRYTKPRGVAQRRTFCEGCHGKGCETCGGSGFENVPSIEELVGGRIARLLSSQRVKFTWLGSEDAESLVLPPGRPFVAEAKSPRKRSVPSRITVRTGRGLARITRLRVLDSRPENYSFRFRTKAHILSEVPVGGAVSCLAKEMKNSVVHYRNNKGKTISKRVYSVRAQARGRRMVAEIELDGGLPVKRLVDGDSVSPSFAELLKTPLRCQRFDILKVWEPSR